MRHHVLPRRLSTPKSTLHNRSNAKIRALRSGVRCSAATGQSVEASRVLRVRYLRKDQNYKGWGLHVWGEVVQETDWANALKPSGAEDGAVYWDVEVRSGSPKVGLLVHKGEDKSAGGEEIHVQEGQPDVWLVANSWTPQLTRPDLSSITPGSLHKSYAHWVSKNELVWRMPVAGDDGEAHSFALHYSKPAYMHITGAGVQNAQVTVPLEVVGPSVSPAVMKRFPHLYGCATLRVPDEYLDQVPELLKGQLAASCSSTRGEVLEATGVQVQGVLDDLFTYDGPLGSYTDPLDNTPKLSVWAPTAQKVEVLHWTQARGGEPDVIPMTEDKGVWTLAHPAEWKGTYYKYRVTVYSALSIRMETSDATDPYSRATTANGERTIIADLSSPELCPPGWASHTGPPLPSWLHQTIYELHVRDFSATDTTVPEALRGKYRAFCPQYAGQSAGLKHLGTLQQAGLNTIHLLPSYDFGSVPERPEDQRAPGEMGGFPPDSPEPQAILARVADQDAYNWGYDPVNYGVPEGSYSTDPDSPLRVLEYREMVQALHEQGFRVVLDVVYNHTFRAGAQDEYSVLDKVVPGYYHRRAEDGDICHSTCCNNTASEHAMCERLVVDDITHWARTYKVDGFRFDIMGHMMVTTMLKIRASLDGLTLEKDKVDGKALYLYGEGWDFGEVAFNQRGRNASQLNLAGTGLGSFNERLRDPAIGGNPFSSPTKQGFITGLAIDPNEHPGQESPPEQRQELLWLTDHLRYALAGNLRDYETQLLDGKVEKGGKVPLYGSMPVAYGAVPWENVAFIGCHDNETIFDKVMMKAPGHVGAEGRVRMCMMAAALVALSQGVPFFHAGDELLRSKSLDRDSYNSGDWFNRIDWTGQDNNFGVGLPPASKNEPTWPIKGPLLARAAELKPTPDQIAVSAQYFRALLRTRASSDLFRLPSTEDICRQVRFYNTGPSQVPGIVVMEVVSADCLAGSGGFMDPLLKRIVAVFNANPTTQLVPTPPGAGTLVLHPELQKLEDEPTLQCKAEGGMMSVPGRTTAVFVETR